MKVSVNYTIGRPALHIADVDSGFRLSLELPREATLEMIREHARWVVHNGTTSERDALRTIATELLECLPPA